MPYARLKLLTEQTLDLVLLQKSLYSDTDTLIAHEDILQDYK